MTTQSFRCKTCAHIHTTVSEVIKKAYIQSFRTISENQCLLQILKVIMIGRRYIIKAFKDSNRYEHDHLGKFDAKADDGYFLRYSFNFKAFRVFNTRRQQIEETYHVTFDESIEGIRFTNTSVDEIGIDDSSRYPPDEFP
ncbi:hypothetical protein Tco_1499501 [Tanacetum coccineum]